MLVDLAIGLCIGNILFWGLYKKNWNECFTAIWYQLLALALVRIIVL